MKSLSEISAQVKRNAVSDKNIGNYFSINIISGGYGAVYSPVGDVSKVLWRLFAAIIRPSVQKPMNGGIYG